MKRSSSGHVALMRPAEDEAMNTMDASKRPADDLLDVARALLLLQGAILFAATIEAAIWGAIFPSGGASVLMSGLSAAVILVAPVRLRADRAWSRRLVYLVEGLSLAAIAVDIALAVAIAHAFPPIVALVTQLVLPTSVVLLLRRSAREAAGAAPAGVPGTIAALGRLS
jgi:hypothetical protein